MERLGRAEALNRAIAVAVDNVADAGGPFGAVLVGPANQIIVGSNRVTTTNDPTAHAEVVAIREACRLEGRFSLEGWWLYASCEPCPMCLAACLWARLEGVTFAAVSALLKVGQFRSFKSRPLGVVYLVLFSGFSLGRVSRFLSLVR